MTAEEWDRLSGVESPALDEIEEMLEAVVDYYENGPRGRPSVVRALFRRRDREKRQREDDRLRPALEKLSMEEALLLGHKDAWERIRADQALSSI